MSFLPEPPDPEKIRRADEVLELLDIHDLEGTPNMKAWILPILEKLLKIQASVKNNQKK